MREWVSDLIQFLKSVILRWFNVFAGAFVTAVWTIYQQLTGKPLPMTAFWSLVGLCGFLATFLAFRDHYKSARLLSEKLAPRLSVSISDRSITHAWWSGGRMMTFFRVIVSSLSSSSIEDARGYLVSIEKSSKIVWDSEDVPLTFSPGEDPDTLCKRIEDGGTYPLDVVVVSHDDNKLLLGTLGRTWPRFKSPEEIFSERGDYILNLRISAKDCPSVHPKVKFSWTGNASTCAIGLVESSKPLS